MSVNHKANIPGYNKKLWFIRRDITNIIVLEKITEQYRVTYDCNDHMLIVHTQGSGIPNMEFLMHDSGLYQHEPLKKTIVFHNTVSKNKEGFSKRKIKIAVKTQGIQHTLVFTTVKELKWIIRSNQIQYCPIETEDVEMPKRSGEKTRPI